MIFVLLVLSLKSQCYANDITSGYWTGLFATGKVTQDSSFGYFFELQSRLHNDSIGKKNDRVLIRPAISYRLNENFSLFLGAGWTPALSPFRGEFRPWQQVLFNKKFDADLVSLRTRLEQRMVQNSLETSHRIRQMLRYEAPINLVWSLLVWDELFWSLNSVSGLLPSGFDQNRIFVGTARYLGAGENTKSSRFEIGYLNVFNRSYKSTQSDLMSQLFVFYFYTDLPLD